MYFFTYHLVLVFNITSDFSGFSGLSVFECNMDLVEKCSACGSIQDKFTSVSDTKHIKNGNIISLKTNPGVMDSSRSRPPLNS